MLYNSTTKKKVCSDVIRLENMFSIGTGLMMRGRDSVKDTAWIFIFNRPRVLSITTFFMRFPIDILFLDDKKKIIEIKHSMKPWHNYMSTQKPSYVIELDSGIVKSKNIKIGHHLKF